MTNRDIVGQVGYVLRRNGIGRGIGLLAAVSGGKDSVVLLDVLRQLRPVIGFSLYCLHVNHHMREEAGEDAAFVEALCKEWRVPFFLREVDVPGYRKTHMLSPEATARELRYEALEDTRRECSADWIVTAHHADDQTETVLLRLIRGASPAGLCGMTEKRGHILRPMLEITAAEILAYARREGLCWHEDRTNMDTDIPRNGLRHTILPALTKLHPGAAENIRRAAIRFRRDEDFFDGLVRPILAQAEAIPGGKRIPTIALAGQHPAVQYRALAALAAEEGLSERHLTAAMDLLGENRAGKQVFAPNGLRIQREHDMLLFVREIGASPKNFYPLQTGEQILSDGLRLCCDVADSIENASPECQYFDGDCLPDTAVLRHPMQGDWMVPLGMKGRKKLGDVLTDAHYSRFRREEMWILAAEDRVLWIPALVRIDESVKITENTLRILRITLI